MILHSMLVSVLLQRDARKLPPLTHDEIEILNKFAPYELAFIALLVILFIFLVIIPVHRNKDKIWRIKK